MRPNLFKIIAFGKKRLRRTSGMSLIEVMVSTSLSMVFLIALSSLSIMVHRSSRSIFYQQFSVKEARSTIEGVNRQIRLATLPLIVTNDAWEPMEQGNRIQFQHFGEEMGARSLELVSKDDDLMTAWDNKLLFDPDTSSDGNEIVMAKWLTPTESAGMFSYSQEDSSLVIRLRIGDPTINGGSDDPRSGPGMQGIDIDIKVSPRN